jgi:hypothetical protein
MRVLCAVLYDDRGVSPHQHVSMVVLIRIHRVSSFGSFFWNFYLRNFVAHSDGVSLVVVGVVFRTVLMNCIVM